MDVISQKNYKNMFFNDRFFMEEHKQILSDNSGSRSVVFHDPYSSPTGHTSCDKIGSHLPHNRSSHRRELICPTEITFHTSCAFSFKRIFALKISFWTSLAQPSDKRPLLLVLLNPANPLGADYMSWASQVRRAWRVRLG